MKRIILTLILMLAIQSVEAYEIKENPDRKISFGFNYIYGAANSEWSFAGFKINEFTKTKSDDFLFDVKVPLSSLFTFQLRGGISNQTNDIFTGERVKHNGYDIGIGMRCYLP